MESYLHNKELQGVESWARAGAGVVGQRWWRKNEQKLLDNDTDVLCA